MIGGPIHCPSVFGIFQVSADAYAQEMTEIWTLVVRCSIGRACSIGRGTLIILPEGKVVARCADL